MTASRPPTADHDDTGADAAALRAVLAGLRRASRPGAASVVVSPRSAAALAGLLAAAAQCPEGVVRDRARRASRALHHDNR